MNALVKALEDTLANALMDTGTNTLVNTLVNALAQESHHASPPSRLPSSLLITQNVILYVYS